MKLKELHIRNIASIERADIDFENDLNDAITGEPASIFLIAGDTGAGKSVILDCISMALYKKTPRIASVANPANNDYTDTEGEQIRVASIEQYTRLGISPKDESYSEVVFDDKDGRTYHARLTLGLKHGRKDKETGIRPISHRKPTWELKIDKGDWTDDSVEQTILQAVGLDFQQFGRMAMLAQGQFANFLTGNKKEREAILEQLTNTQLFSDYGEAIQRIWKKAKEAQTQAQMQYDVEKPHTLTDEQVELMTREQADAQLLADQLKKEIAAIDGKLKHIETIQQNEKRQAEARMARQELEAKRAGDEYRQCKTLFTDWDNTTTQRQQLTDLAKAQQEEAKAKARLSQTHELFQLLTSDLADRQTKAKTNEAAISQLQQWVDKEAHHEELFLKAGETNQIIGQYVEKVEKTDLLSAKLRQEKDKTDMLRKAEQETRSNAEEAEKEVKLRQDQIDALSKKRADLHPQTVIEELRRQHTRRQQLSDLLTAIDNLSPAREESLALKAKLQEEEETLKTLGEASSKADADYQARKLTAEKATQRLTTMKMSLDEKIKELRHRLYDEHTEHCPLCGQHIDHIHLDDEFKDMLTPLEEEQRQAKQQLSRSETLRDQAMSSLKQLAGTHRNNQGRYEDNEKKIALAQAAIDKKATTLGLDLHHELSQQIALATGQLAASITKLETAQSEAERLQDDINRLMDEKKPLDANKAKADKARLEAQTAAKANADAISRMEKDMADLTEECKDVRAELSSLLADYDDDWQADAAATPLHNMKQTAEHLQALRVKLLVDAKTFISQRQRLADSRVEQERTRALMATLEHYRDDILGCCPDWTVNDVARAYPCSNINTQWTTLLANVTSLVTKQQDSKALIATTEQALTAYYQATGKTSETLIALTAQEPEVAAARRLVNETDAQLQSRVDAIAEAQRLIDEASRELGIADREALPDKQALEDRKTSVSQRRDEALGRQTQARTQLELHRKNIERLKAIERQLEKTRKHFERWDKLNNLFGGTRFRTLVQTYILRPLLNNANIYLEQITDRYRLTCSEDNDQLSILVLDRYNKNQVRSVTVLSGGERFMISLALSLALSSLNRPDMNINILFIDEGFGTLDEKSLDSVMATLEKLQEIAGQTNRRVGIISHREELQERIPVKIQVVKKGEGRSNIEIHCQS